MLLSTTIPVYDLAITPPSSLLMDSVEEGGERGWIKPNQSNVVIKLCSYYPNRTLTRSFPPSLSRECRGEIDSGRSSTDPTTTTLAFVGPLYYAGCRGFSGFTVFPLSLSLLLFSEKKRASYRRRDGVSRLVRLIAIEDLVTGRGTALRSTSSRVSIGRALFA